MKNLYAAASLKDNMTGCVTLQNKTQKFCFAAGSKGLLELKTELLSKGMSDAEAEEYLRTL